MPAEFAKIAASEGLQHKRYIVKMKHIFDCCIIGLKKI